ncbi:08f6dbcc-c013-4a35-a574-b9aa393bb53e [Sclerotinia trifoliorum]|uniref:08f6dbcc-c013-4a35-a574-b9aa393bb53e n=1 Tax=Sclerotinia trifoliorum TaxID=28548 RepID=A0A8H2VU38_9HELO|nr:08f6dbcc-c013-4a35-a574-b9aa393bb53e [Sclerotinia trifoliorum]
MAGKTAAQEEFDTIIAKASARENHNHPDDERDYSFDRENSDIDEEEEYHNRNIEENMKMPLFDRSNSGGMMGLSEPLRLPHRDFDSGRSTGVKGVIADARSFEEARKTGGARRSRSASGSGSEEGLSDDEEFLERWRQQRRVELQSEEKDVRSRRTSPSVRRYGRFDEVDALGYLDAIEKVGRETIVVVFVYDPECDVSQVINSALLPLVTANPTVHFVRVHYEDVEFDNAGVPAILAYKNQGDLFANLTYIIDQIPDDTIFDTKALKDVLVRHQIL